MNAIVIGIEEFAPLVADFLSALASAPASSSWITPSIDALLNAGAALVSQGAAGTTALQALTAQIKQMVAAKRDPTAEEWAALEARAKAAHAIIQGTPGGAAAG